MNKLAIVGLVFGIIAFILDLLMVAMPWWVRRSTTLHSGLWEICESINNDYYVCRLFSSAGIDRPAWLDGCASMELIGLLFVTVSMVCGCLLTFCFKSKSQVYIVAWACEFISALFVAIGVIIFMCKYPLSSLHVCFYFSWFGLLFSIAAGFCFFLAKRAISDKDF